MKNNLIIASLVGASLLTACASLTTMKQYDDTIYVSSSTFEKREIADVISQVGKDLGWEMEKASLSRIRATRTSGKEKASIQIKYNRSSFDITYDDSENLSYDKNQNKILSTYNDWITELHDAIEDKLQQK